MPHFVLIDEQGPNWDDARSMREQDGWAEHAKFMNALVEDRFVLLGGPVREGSKHRALLIVNSLSERTIRDRLAQDPWIRSGVLRIVTISPWELLLGELK